MNENIAQTLTDMARKRPYQEAVIFPEGRNRQGRPVYSHLSFAELDRLSTELAKGLYAFGIGRGLRTAFMVKPSLDFFISCFALFKAGAIPVFIDPGIGLRKMKRCLAEAQVEAFVGIPQAHLARQLFGWKGGGIKKKVSIGNWAYPGTIALPELYRAGRSPLEFNLEEQGLDDMAAILFTSGSTGAPKGAVYSHRTFRTQVTLLQQCLKIEEGERDLCTFPLFALFAPALGMTAIIPEMDFTRPKDVDPEKIREPIEAFGISNLFGSPALLKTVSDYAYKKAWTFPSLRRVMSAGAPVRPELIREFRGLLPERAEFYTPYGATESLPIAIAESRLILEQSLVGQGICVGPPTPGTRCLIMPIQDSEQLMFHAVSALANREIGEIIVQGPQVSRQYYQRPEADRAHKMRDATNGEIWHRTGDLGYFDEQGQLWFCGRKNHRVVTESECLYTIPCEAIFNQHPSVARSALVGLGHRGHEKPALCIEPKKPLSDSERSLLFHELKVLASSYPHTRNIKLFFVHDNFPVDIRHNAKIFREKLKAWAEAQWRKKSLLPAAAGFSAKP